MNMINIEINKGITYITIKNNSHLTLVLSSLGASMFALYYDDELLTLSLKNKDDFLNKELYHGKTIGPVCGRIKDGRIGLYHYEMNEDNVARHGGDNGLSNQNFGYQYNEKNDTISLLFTYQGFTVEYVLAMKEDTFFIKYYYQGHKQPISLTNHSFFHLGGPFNDLRLKINSDEFVNFDKKTLVPLEKEKIIPCLDFNKGQSLNKNINDPYLINSRTKGYDHFLYFSDDKELVLKNKKYQLILNTDFTGVQIYSDNYDFKEETIDGRTGIRKALAVEPQDSPLERKIYSRYRRYIKYTIAHI